MNRFFFASSSYNKKKYLFFHWDAIVLNGFDLFSWWFFLFLFHLNSHLLSIYFGHPALWYSYAFCLSWCPFLLVWSLLLYFIIYLSAKVIFHSKYDSYTLLYLCTHTYTDTDTYSLHTGANAFKADKATKSDISTSSLTQNLKPPTANFYLK